MKADENQIWSQGNVVSSGTVWITRQTLNLVVVDESTIWNLANICSEETENVHGEKRLEVRSRKGA